MAAHHNRLEIIKSKEAFRKDADILVGCHGSLLNHFLETPPTLMRITSTHRNQHQNTRDNRVLAKSLNCVPRLRDILDVPNDIPKNIRYSSDIKDW